MALTRDQIGLRLREVREQIGFTQAHVAQRLQMHRPTISEIEAGRRAVTSEELYRFSDLYATPVSELLGHRSPSVDAAMEVLYRGHEPKNPETKAAIKRFIERCRAERELEGLLDLPPQLDARPHYELGVATRKQDAIQQGVRLAEQERRRLDLGVEPVRGVLDLLERQGVTIGQVQPGEGDEIDGLYVETGELGACVAVNLNEASDWTGFRAVFTSAHEYAHWLLRDRQLEFFWFKAGEEDLQEVRANAFAAGFLMPREGVRAYCEAAGLIKDGRIGRLSPGDVVRAMDHFGVSRQALLYRLRSLDLIEKDTVDVLWDFRVSPVAQALGIELGQREYKGTRLPSLAILAWRRGEISSGRAAELCELDLEEFQDLVKGSGEEAEVPPDAPLLGAAAAG